MASGEMSEAEFRSFLADTLGAAARVWREQIKEGDTDGYVKEYSPKAQAVLKSIAGS